MQDIQGGRRVRAVTITADGRDKGKTYYLKEMPASQAEKWATRLFLAIELAGVAIPENIVEAGLAGVAEIGIKSLNKLRWSEAEPLMDEMMQCIRIHPMPDAPDFSRALVENDIEEVATRLKLRKELFALHTDFFTSDAPSS